MLVIFKYKFDFFWVGGRGAECLKKQFIFIDRLMPFVREHEQVFKFIVAASWLEPSLTIVRSWIRATTTHYEINVFL